jgi:hypothetical protein
MEKLYRIETTLSHDLAELYSMLVEEFESKSSIPLSDLNRTLLQTGLVHHLAMMEGLGLLDEGHKARIKELSDNVSQDTIIWDVLQMVRSYWRDSGGQSGTIDLKA